MASSSYPHDRFDDIPEDLKRVGAHRAPRRKGRGWIWFAWAALATGILVFGGLYGINRFAGVDLGLPGMTAAEPDVPSLPSAAPGITPLTDPATIDPARNISIIVLNGTATVDLEATVADSLAGWPITSRLTAAEPTVETTVVYYSNEADEDIARGLVEVMGVGLIELVAPEQFPGAPITIALGADHPAATAASGDEAPAEEAPVEG